MDRPVFCEPMGEEAVRLRAVVKPGQSPKVLAEDSGEMPVFLSTLTRVGV
jgi:hypothetical protein